MEKIQNSRSATMSDIEQCDLYEKHLVEKIKNGEYQEILNLPIKLRSDKDYMEPLLFAVKNDYNTFIVYKYYGEALQNNSRLAAEILISEPNLIENTAISRNKQFIIDNVAVNPRIIEYMSPNLKADNELIQELINIDNPEINKEIIKISDVKTLIQINPQLCNNKDFMSNAIDKDMTFIEYVSKELKNDKEFIKEKTAQNEMLIDYVVVNVEEFGLEGIKGARESSKDFTIKDCMDIIDELAGSSQDERYEKVRQKIQEKGIEDPHTMRWITAMVAQSDNVSPELVKKVLNYSILTMEKSKQEVELNGEKEINIDNMQSLITPLILDRLMSKIPENEIDDELRQKIEDYKAFYEKYHEQFKESKKKDSEDKIKIGDVKERIKDSRISDIKSSTKETIDAVENESKTIEIQGELQELE